MAIFEEKKWKFKGVNAFASDDVFGGNDDEAFDNGDNNGNDNCDQDDEIFANGFPVRTPITFNSYSLEQQYGNKYESSYVELIGRVAEGKYKGKSIKIDISFPNYFYVEAPSFVTTDNADEAIIDLRNHIDQETSKLIHSISFTELEPARPYSFGRKSKVFKITISKYSNARKIIEYLRGVSDITGEDTRHGWMRICGQMQRIHMFETTLSPKDRWNQISEVGSAGLMNCTHYDFVKKPSSANASASGNKKSFDIYNLDESDLKLYHDTNDNSTASAKGNFVKPSVDLHIRTSIKNIRKETDPVKLNQISEHVDMVIDIETRDLMCEESKAEVLGISAILLNESKKKLAVYYFAWNYHVAKSTSRNTLEEDKAAATIAGSTKYQELSIDGVKMFNCLDEADTLDKFIKFFKLVDADCLIGHNSFSFDHNYLVVRGTAGGNSCTNGNGTDSGGDDNSRGDYHDSGGSNSRAYQYMGRNSSQNGRLKGLIDSNKVNYRDVPGRVHIDTRFFLKMFDMKQNEYSLNASAINHLTDIDEKTVADCFSLTVDQKEPINFSKPKDSKISYLNALIVKTFGSPEGVGGSNLPLMLTRKKGDIPGDKIVKHFESENYQDRYNLALYCIKDSILTLRLFVERTMFLKVYKMSQLFRTTMQSVVISGAQDRIFPNMLHKMHKMGVLFNRYHNDELDPNKDLWLPRKFKGGKVRDPVPGKYNTGVAVLDFGGMYPSIMMHYKLCMQTMIPWRLVSDEEKKWLEDNKIKYIIKTIGKEDTLIVQAPGVGFSYLIQEEMKEQRKARKKSLAVAKEEKDYNAASSHECDQWALKIYMNGMYGLFGVAEGGKFSYFLVSEAICQFGREMSDQAVKETQLIEPNEELVYGDTDSLFLTNKNLKRSDYKTEQEYVDALFDHYSAIVKKVSDSFGTHYIEINLEKIFYPLCLYHTKKYYAGRKWLKRGEPAEKSAELVGLEGKKRDRCPDLRDLGSGVTQLLIIPEDNENEICKLVYNRLMVVAKGEVKMENFVIIKQLNKKLDEYDSKSPHVSVALKNLKRSNNEGSSIGARACYIIFTDKYKNEHSKVSDYSEDLEYAIQHNMKIDSYWYIKEHYFNPLNKLLSITGINLEKICQKPLEEAKLNSSIGQISLESVIANCPHDRKDSKNSSPKNIGDFNYNLFKKNNISSNNSNNNNKSSVNGKRKVQQGFLFPNMGNDNDNNGTSSSVKKTNKKMKKNDTCGFHTLM